ncbi:hypothetical protein BDV59DRAFT_169524 [Aspergillus ambiguus]|uniref:uncharacterized protein n=1 Tax=Aspergillus ambiguus TaxID=176160 RepID=UPI003CCCB538
MGDVRPTAKWANRMLRPLTSIYHRLEKHHEILASIAHSKLREQADARRSGQTAPSARTTTDDADEGYSYSDEEPGDPAWVPGKTDKRRIRHSYASGGQKNGVRRRSRLSIHSPERQKTLPGAIEIATPLITGKAQGIPECSSLRKRLFRSPLVPINAGASGEQRRTSRTNNTSFPAYQGSWKEVLDLSGDTGLVDIAHLLDRILLKFLSKTRVFLTDGRTEHGARSLMSMIVRRLPEFIAEEQRLQDELRDDDCDVDMCDAYFTELETHYAPTGNGWGPLREAVRAQGIHLVSEMMHQGWLTPSASCRLMAECMNHDEFDAFEGFMSRYLATVQTYDYPMTFEPPKPSVHHDDAIYLLGRYYARAAERRPFVYNELTKLLMRGAVPPEWMVTSLWKKCVDGAIKSVSVDDGNAAAATRLVEAVVLSAGGVHLSKQMSFSRVEDLSIRPERPRGTRGSSNAATLAKDQSPCPVPVQDALSNLTSSLVAALCGMSIVRSQAPTDEVRTTGLKVRNTVGYLSLTVQRAVATQLPRDSILPLFQSLRRGYVLLGDLMLRGGATPSPLNVIDHFHAVPRRDVQSFLLSLADQHEMLKGLAELVRQVFRCCGHSDKDRDSRTPREVRQKVSELAQLTGQHGIAVFLGKVAAETAMALAETTLDTDDHAWAIEIQEMVVSTRCSQRGSQSPSSHVTCPNDAAGLYRWEESIGEWVARTPMPKLKSASVGFTSKYAPARPRIPSTIACSTSSHTASSSQEDAVTSVTSSAPSLSPKRTYTGGSYVTRSCKRFRMDPSAVGYVGQGHSTRLRSDRPPSKTRSSESENAPIVGSREALDGGSTDIETASDADSEEVTPKVEVVIINNHRSDSPSDTESLEDFVDPISERRRSTRLRTALIMKPRRRQTASSGIVCQRSTRLSTVIPCSQEESDDELSFL